MRNIADMTAGKPNADRSPSQVWAVKLLVAFYEMEERCYSFVLSPHQISVYC
jgi:hypothetical protein